MLLSDYLKFTFSSDENFFPSSYKTQIVYAYSEHELLELMTCDYVYGIFIDDIKSFDEHTIQNSNIIIPPILLLKMEEFYNELSTHGKRKFHKMFSEVIYELINSNNPIYLYFAVNYYYCVYDENIKTFYPIFDKLKVILEYEVNRQRTSLIQQTLNFDGTPKTLWDLLIHMNNGVSRKPEIQLTYQKGF